MSNNSFDSKEFTVEDVYHAIVGLSNISCLDNLGLSSAVIKISSTYVKYSLIVTIKLMYWPR